MAAETAELICQYDAFSLQEVYKANRPLDERMYKPANGKVGEIGPFDLAFVNDLEERLARTHVVYFEPYFTVPGLHDNEPDFHGQADFGCMVAVKKQLYHVHNSGITYSNGHLNKEPIYPDHKKGKTPLRYGRPASRSAHVVSFLTNSAECRLSYLSGHGIWSRHGKVDIPARLSQNIGWTKLVTDHRRRHNLCNATPLVFMGDQNYQSKLECFKDLLQRKELFGDEGGVNLNELFDITDTRNKYYPGTVRQADFALASASLWHTKRIISVTANPDTSSDHALITGEVDI
jgi:hypothetical protein